ncbi:hypothetical protein [Pseudarthrobacter sp. B4EP4b]|uniref:hypothetical protein n=1 Tax=Pseudarthrobacter sp. B4EP4b TaxID=2590664 RepID=UPI001152C266|nr:hypothetical protein [Pseudarthrobacter sp. B4EP4b]
MNPFSTQADTGDLVAARKDFATTLTDELTNTVSVRRGTRGLVRQRAGKRLTVAFDTSYGLTEATVHARDCRLIRHTANEKRFMNWAQLKASVRVGALIALTAPIAWFIIIYWAETGSPNGVIEALTISAIESTLELPGLILTHPTQTLIWLAAGALTTRIALGSRPRFLRNRRR